MFAFTAPSHDGHIKVIVGLPSPINGHTRDIEAELTNQGLPWIVSVGETGDVLLINTQLSMTIDGQPRTFNLEDYIDRLHLALLKTFPDSSLSFRITTNCHFLWTRRPDGHMTVTVKNPKTGQIITSFEGIAS